jgi:hypothetical protein
MDGEDAVMEGDDVQTVGSSLATGDEGVLIAGSFVRTADEYAVTGDEDGRIDGFDLPTADTYDRSAGAGDETPGKPLV